MTNPSSIKRLKTGVANLDAILQGGLPKGSLTVFGGNPGSGKTILSQQIGFFNASPEFPVVYFQTLSEPTAKTMAYVSQFAFFEQEKIGKSVHFVDLGDILRTRGMEPAVAMFVENLKKFRPGMVVIDSFKAFEDLAQSSELLRKFSYEVAIQLMAWECTSFLLGEFGKTELETSPLFSIVDGIIVMSQRQESGEQQRFVQVLKMRGTNHDRDEHSLAISDDGIQVYAPRVTIQRLPQADVGSDFAGRLKTGVHALDGLIQEGIPRGSSCLISGVSGTGKSLLSLELLYRGAADFNEKGALFLFEETKERALAAASNMGWDLAAQVKRGMIEIIYIPQPEIQVEMHLLMMHEIIARLGAKRVVIDSVSIFLHKVTQEQIIREKIYQLATIIQNVGAVGFFITDVPSGTQRLSKYGVEETVVDGVILLDSEKVGTKRERHLEVYKLRNTEHKSGTYVVEIGKSGIKLRGRQSTKSRASGSKRK